MAARLKTTEMYTTVQIISTDMKLWKVMTKKSGTVCGLSPGCALFYRQRCSIIACRQEYTKNFIDHDHNSKYSSISTDNDNIINR